jgi:hypothetical protein
MNILLKATQAGACTVSQLEFEVDWCCYSGEELSTHDMDGSLLLSLQEFEFQFEWQMRSDHSLRRALQHFDNLSKKIPSDLKAASLSSDIALLRTNTEPREISRALSAGLRHQPFTAIRSNGLENFHLSKMVSYQNSLLSFLDAHRGSLKKLVLDEVYLHGEWDNMLSRIAKAFSLEHFKLSNAQKVIENLRSSRVVARYSEDCEFRSKYGMRQDLNMVIELQEVERRAKEREKRRPLELERPRRSARLTEKEISEDQELEN